MLIGGAMACTFFKAMGLEVGKSLVKNERVDMARALIGRAGDKLVLPSDARVAPGLEQPKEAHVVARASIPAYEAMLDIGSATQELFASIITEAGTVVWNGPMGVFETSPFD